MLSCHRGQEHLHKKALVLGAARSGMAAARLLVSKRWHVTVVDQAPAPTQCGHHDGSSDQDFSVFYGCETLPEGPFDLTVVSPGFAIQSEWVQVQLRHCPEVISELELGWRHCQCPLVAVTGTNGKSTLTQLIVECLQQDGKKAETAGNFGTPLSERVMALDPLDWLVVEVSSFQLELKTTLRPRIAVLLNVQTDHLDRHGSMDVYRGLKCKLFACQKKGDTAIVYDPDAPGGCKVPLPDDVRSIVFGSHRQLDIYYDAHQHAVCGVVEDGPVCMSLQGSELDNAVMGMTAAAAVAAALSCGVSLQTVESAIQQFRPLPHRMQRVATCEGVTWINDSKATNLAAMAAAIERCPAPVRLLAGGQIKEKDVIFVKEVLKKKVASVYLIGEAASKLYDAWSDVVNCCLCGDLKTAVEAAWKASEPGDSVLLSPGCASFDQFQSYADRGTQFCNLVNDRVKLKKERYS